MLGDHEYVNEKLRSFHIETLDRESVRPSAPKRQRRPAHPMVSAGGRLMRRLGESLEQWAAMEPSPQAATSDAAGFKSSNDLEPCTDC